MEMISVLLSDIFSLFCGLDTVSNKSLRIFAISDTVLEICRNSLYFWEIPPFLSQMTTSKDRHGSES